MPVSSYDGAGTFRKIFGIVILVNITLEFKPRFEHYYTNATTILIVNY